MMIDVTLQILKFRDFLVHSWPDLDRLMENHDWDDDGSFTQQWLQVNWEFLVERELLEKKGFLKSYVFDDFRITNSDVTANYAVICKPKPNKMLIDDRTKKVIESDKVLFFAGFEAKLNPGYGIYPPFDYLTVFTRDRKSMYELSVEDIDFYMIRISEL